MAKSNIHTRLVGVFFLASTLLAGCDVMSSDTTKTGRSIAGFNYTAHHLNRIIVTDKFGNQANGDEALLSGMGAGRLGCCHTLKGTEFLVQWEVHEAGDALRLIDTDGPIRTMQKTVKVQLPPVAARGVANDQVLGLHFYPDDRVELEFRADAGGMRLHSAVGAWVRKMEALRESQPDVYEESSLAPQQADDESAYRIPDLIDAYRDVVPREDSPNTHAKKEAFVRWLAVRYQSPAFRESVIDPAEEATRLHLERTVEIREAQDAFHAARRSVPTDHEAIGKASARLRAAREAQDLALPQTALDLSRPIMIADSQGDDEQMRRHAVQAGLRAAVSRVRKMEREAAAGERGEASMSPETLALVQAWKEGAEGSNPLPDHVMALFDMLVNDTMLVSARGQSGSSGRAAPHLQARAELMGDAFNVTRK